MCVVIPCGILVVLHRQKVGNLSRWPINDIAKINERVIFFFSKYSDLEHYKESTCPMLAFVDDVLLLYHYPINESEYP